ncbi:hypothetical protein Tco_0095897 [Tanacetum coccineum]
MGVLSAAKVLADAAKTNIHTYTGRRREVSTSNDGISTAGASMPVSTVVMIQEVNISILSPVVVKDKDLVMKQQWDCKRNWMKKKDKGWLEFIKQLNLLLKEEWENIRARVEADEELTQRLQAEERDKYNEVDQAKMLVDLINERKRYFIAQKAEAKRNKPMTQAQQRNYMINYIKHMGKTGDKGRASEVAAGSSQTTIIDFLEVRSSKRAAEAELDHEGSKRQKTNEASGSIQEQPKEEEKELSQEDL